MPKMSLHDDYDTIPARVLVCVFYLCITVCCDVFVIFELMAVSFVLLPIICPYLSCVSLCIT
jgi:hypothetical protein